MNKDSLLKSTQFNYLCSHNFGFFRNNNVCMWESVCAQNSNATALFLRCHFCGLHTNVCFCKYDRWCKTFFFGLSIQLMVEIGTTTAFALGTKQTYQQLWDFSLVKMYITTLKCTLNNKRRKNTWENTSDKIKLSPLNIGQKPASKYTDKFKRHNSWELNPFTIRF